MLQSQEEIPRELFSPQTAACSFGILYPIRVVLNLEASVEYEDIDVFNLALIARLYFLFTLSLRIIVGI